MMAFPDPHRTDIKGMTLVDYFAAKVMQALVSETGLTMPDFAKTAYDTAEDMMQERRRRFPDLEQ
jgi:hypothetical protein